MSLVSITGMLALAAGGLVFIQQARPQGGPPGGPTITWSVPELSETMFPGTSSTTTVSFRSSQNLSNVALELTPSLDGMVSVSPTTFPTITAGQTHQVNVTMKAPPAFQKRSFGGTLHVKSEDKPPRTYANPLNIGLKTDWASLTGTGFSLFYPPGWYVLPSPDRDRTVLSSTPTSPPYEGAPGADIELLVEPNPDVLLLDAWVAKAFGIAVSTLSPSDVMRGSVNGTPYLVLFGVVPSADPDNVHVFVPISNRLLTLRGSRSMLDRLMAVLFSLQLQ